MTVTHPDPPLTPGFRRCRGAGQWKNTEAQGPTGGGAYLRPQICHLALCQADALPLDSSEALAWCGGRGSSDTQTEPRRPGARGTSTPRRTMTPQTNKGGGSEMTDRRRGRGFCTSPGACHNHSSASTVIIYQGNDYHLSFIIGPYMDNSVNDSY